VAVVGGERGDDVVLCLVGGESSDEQPGGGGVGELVDEGGVEVAVELGGVEQDGCDLGVGAPRGDQL